MSYELPAAPHGGKSKHRRKAGLISLRSLRRASRKRLALTLTALLAVCSIAVAGTWAAWTATDTNPTNTFATTGILLDDSQGGEAGSTTNAGTATFTVTGLAPGFTSISKCIEVDYVGTASAMTFAVTATETPGALSQLGSVLTLAGTYKTGGTASVTAGSNTNAGSCTGYTSASGSVVTLTGSPQTVSAWNSAGSQAIATVAQKTWYQFTISDGGLSSASCNTQCGQTVTVTFTWTLTAT